MFSKIKTWALGILAGLAGIFYLFAQHQGKQRKKAETERDTAKRNTEAVTRSSEETKQVAEAVSEVRQENAQEDQKRHDTPKEERRTGNFGSAARRLRDD